MVKKKTIKNGSEAFTEQGTVTSLRVYVTKKVQIEQVCNSTHDFFENLLIKSLLFLCYLLNGKFFTSDLVHLNYKGHSTFLRLS